MATGSDRGTVLITGASTGIGRASALVLDAAGFRVFAGVRKEADGDALRQAGSPRLAPITLDVTDTASIAAAAAAVADVTGSAGLAGLVNNAGIAVAAPLEFVPLEALRRQLEVNVTGQVAVTQAFLPLLRRARGRIVNMGSIGGRVATPFLGPYGASKFALEGMSDALRMELRPWGIQVSVIEPGAIATPIWEKSLAVADNLMRDLPPAAHALYGEAIAAVRTRTAAIPNTATSPEAVARAVLHALSAPRPKTRYVIGRDARLQALAGRLVPDRLRDLLIARAMRLPVEASGATAAGNDPNSPEQPALAPDRAV